MIFTTNGNNDRLFKSLNRKVKKETSLSNLP